MRRGGRSGIRRAIRRSSRTQADLPVLDPTGLLTVDVEDWYHPLIKDPAAWRGLEDRIVPATERLLRVLAEADSRGTFFVLGCVAQRHPELVRRILADGHEVGSHGNLHQALWWMVPESFRQDLRTSVAALQAAGAPEIVSFRAPYFSVDQTTSWAWQILADEGFRIDSSIFPLQTGYYGQKGAPNVPHRVGAIYEFPITLPRYAGQLLPLCGGFYSRFFPRSWTLASISRVSDTGEQPMFYIHPWELDAGQPRVRVGAFLTFRHYLRLDRTEETLRQVLKTCRWQTLRESLEVRMRAETN